LGSNSEYGREVYMVE
jgi:hypothetical protein